MRITWTNTVFGQENLREQWNALALRMEKPEVFYTWEWAAAVERSYGATLSPWIAIAHDGELVGVAALARTSPKEAVFLAGTTADYCDFVSTPEDRQEFVSRVLSELKHAGVEKVIFANLPADSCTVAALHGSREFKSFLRTGYVCAQIRLGSEDERQALLGRFLAKKVVRRALSALARVGPVTLRHEDDASLGKGPLERFYAMHVARFLATGRISNLATKERRLFLTELSHSLSAKGWLRLSNLFVGDRIIATHYGFQYAGSWFWYQPTFVNEFEEYSPGLCLLTKIVEAACGDSRVQQVDMGLGAEGYKERFANAERTTLHVTLTRDAIPYGTTKMRYRAAEAIKARPKIEARVRRVQMLALRARGQVRDHGVKGVAQGTGKVLQRLFASRDEVCVFRWRGEGNAAEVSGNLVVLTWECLAQATMRYCEDQEALAYLLWSAEQLRLGKTAGYALLGPDGVAQLFAWTTPGDDLIVAGKMLWRGHSRPIGVLMPGPPSDGFPPESVMIFDCWTLGTGSAICGAAIRELATRLAANGKVVWMFEGADSPALAEIERAGFEVQYSVIRRRVLGWTRTWQELAKTTSQAGEAPLTRQAVR